MSDRPYGVSEYTTGWAVRGEEQGAMRKLGRPNQTRAEIVEVAATPAA